MLSLLLLLALQTNVCDFDDQMCRIAELEGQVRELRQELASQVRWSEAQWDTHREISYTSDQTRSDERSTDDHYQLLYVALTVGGIFAGKEGIKQVLKGVL